MILNSDGTVDTTFGTGGFLALDVNDNNGNNYLRSMVELSNGQLLGATNNFNDFMIVRLIENSNVPHISQNVNQLTTTGGDFFQWLLNGNLIPGATSNVYIPIQNGIYSVMVTDSLGCSCIRYIFCCMGGDK